MPDCCLERGREVLSLLVRPQVHGGDGQRCDCVDVCQATPEGKFARWIIRLQDYTYDVKHRAGALNQVADALSRNPCEGSLPQPKEGWIWFSQQDVSNSQRYDSDLAAIITSLEDTEMNSKFVLPGRTLYRRHWTSNQEERQLLVIPSTMRSEILRAMHDAPEGGHVGRRATLQKIQERSWWPRMERSVQLYVASCEVSQKHKRRPVC